MTETPLWLQGRTAVVEATDPAQWRDGVPDYHLSHTVMPGQRTHQFAPDSLEAIVEQIVQVFEMEVSHKKDPQTWVSMVTEHFRTNVNGGPWASAQDIAETGSYNILIGNSAFYRSGQESFESSHHIFHKAFPGGFYWEVLEVLSPPPVVTFKWRHWGAFEGEYHGFQPDGRTIEMFGVSVAKVTDDLKLLQVEHFYDPNEFLGRLTGGCPVAH
ncbi:SnoaL-like polyketide cyclase [Dactylosporangium sp. AC04546]|uniref:SnoaL-like polyketide cyclase n=1 Tax=Dactylosporangium sp. AC04546 TaxID=2862460 RepID=UPI001EE0B0C8|nr:SnoaL-like polyketide cyclase [Dactylosporangium sp. AC04546]WVK83531.1 SnoaL-like polyketide cyclase [Dactylosporangium sp. AC04546]